MREILLEMYEKLWNADKDKFAWNAILKETLEKLDTFNIKREMNHEAFDKMMGYAMHTVTELVEKAKEINRNSIIALNNRDLKDNGIERD
jgi:hypothetical protein